MVYRPIQTDLFRSEYISARTPSDKLMVVLHGRGDSSRPFRTFNSEMRLPEMNYLLLNAPRKYLNGFSWYGEPPYLAENLLEIRTRLLMLMNDLESQGWKSENIFLLGFSQGCLVSADLALNYPKKLAGVIGVSGYFHFYPRWRKNLERSNSRTPWLLTHGRKDDVLKIEDTRKGVEKLREVGLKVDWFECDKKHDFVAEDYPVIRKWIRDKLEV